MRRTWWLLLVAGLVAMGTGPVARSAPAATSAVRLAAAAQVSVVIAYPDCGTSQSGRGPLPAGLIGLDRATVSALLPGWRVVGLAPDLLSLARQVPDCPGDFVTLAPRDGHVAILAGPPGDTRGLLRITTIPLRGLSPADARRVAAGWRVAAGNIDAVLAGLLAPSSSSTAAS